MEAYILNVAFFLVPKINVAYIYEDFTIRQGLEKMRAHGYTAIPVLNRDNLYVGTVSEGDFLWYLVGRKLSMPDMDQPLPDAKTACIRDIMNPSRNPSVQITASIEELVHRAENQNFIPVVDDRNMFIGIVTRKDIIHYYTAKAEQAASELAALG